MPAVIDTPEVVEYEEHALYEGHDLYKEQPQVHVVVFLQPAGKYQRPP